jgi:hypothetical protein
METPTFGALRLSKSTIRRHSAMATASQAEGVVHGSQDLTCSTFSCPGDTNTCQYCFTVFSC